MLICLHQRAVPRVSSESFLFSCSACLLHNHDDVDDNAFSISAAWMWKISQFRLSQLSGLSICTACTLIMPQCIVIYEGKTRFRFTALECTLALLPFKRAGALSMSRRAVSTETSRFLARWQHKQHIAARRCLRASRFNTTAPCERWSVEGAPRMTSTHPQKTQTTSYSQLLRPTELAVDTDPSLRWSLRHLRMAAATMCHT